MQNNEDKVKKKTEPQEEKHTPAGQKDEETANSHKTSPELSDSGFTKTFRRPLADDADSLSRKAEDIQAQYEKLKKAKKLAISGVTSTFGDLLKSKPTESPTAIEKEILDNTDGARQECELKAKDQLGD